MQYVYPKSIVAVDGDIEGAELLFNEKPLQIGLNEPELCIIRGCGYILLDFGKEVSGGARLLTYLASGGVKVRLRFGESVGETCAEIGEKNATNDHALRDLTVELQNYSDMTFGQTGFRFLRVDVLSENKTLALKSVVAAVDTDMREEIGSFECDDPLVNEIWRTAAYTLRLCLQNGYFWDGVKRDRLVWIGDLYPEVRAAQCIFGNVPETLNSLEFAKREKGTEGWFEAFPSYALWWMIILAAEYRNGGEKNALNAYLPYIKELLRQFSDRLNEDGCLTFGGNFIDWPSYYVEGEPIEKKLDSETGMIYLMKIAMKEVSAVLQECGEDDALCRDILRRLDKASLSVQKYKQIAALGVWAGDKSENNARILLSNGAKGLSTFMSYPILTAVATLGEAEQALEMMKEYYGGMLSVGATTFWEDFDLEWLKGAGRIDELPRGDKKDIHGDCGAFCYKGYRHSFCHGWSAGVIPYMVETLAGIKVIEEGKVCIQPRLSGLKYVKVNYPTPYGSLCVEHRLQENGEVKTAVSAPKEIEVTII